MSTRKEIYLKLSQVLSEMEVYTHIDLYKAQLDNPNDSVPFCMPAAFISINSIDYESMPFATKEQKAQIDILLFFDVGGDTFNGAADQQNTLDLMDIVERTKIVLDCLQWSHFSPLELITDQDLTQRYQRPAYKISFTTVLFNRLKVS